MNDMWGNPMGGMNNYPRYNANNFFPHYELIKVKGEDSAKNFRMGPNSNALLLDENEPILYHVQTDGTGYLTVMAYNLVPRAVQQPIDLNQLNQRITQLEELINARQSNSQPNRQKKQRATATATTTTDTTSQTVDELV